MPRKPGHYASPELAGRIGGSEWRRLSGTPWQDEFMLGKAGTARRLRRWSTLTGSSV
jgi:hypothetical protein